MGKHLLIIFATALSVVTGTASCAAESDLYKLLQYHYGARVALFAKENVEAMNVVLLGDSITEGFDVKKHFPGKNVINRGIGGDTIGTEPRSTTDTRGVVFRLKESVNDCNTTHVFLKIGINDMNGGRKPEEMIVDYRNLVSKLRADAPDVTLHIQSLLPTSKGFASKNADVVQMNTFLQALAEETKADYVDLHSLMKDEKGELKADFTEDGLHLLPPAYEVWAKVIQERMGW